MRSPDNLSRTLGPSVLKQTHQVGVHRVSQIIVGVGGDLMPDVLAQDLLSVPEVDRPEAIVAPDLPEHLVVGPLHPEGRVVEEDVLEGPGVQHGSQVDPGQVVVALRLVLGLLDVHVVEVPGQLVHQPHQPRQSVHQVHPPGPQVVQGGGGGRV